MAISLFLTTSCKKEGTASRSLASESEARASQAPAPSEYAYGTLVKFDAKGDSKQYQVSGWSAPEQEFTWTHKPEAVLAFRLEQPNVALVLEMTLQGLVNGTVLPFQPVEVSVNGRKIATWQVSRKETFRTEIPHDLSASPGVLNIVLKMPKAATPASLGMSDDKRLLGVRCFDVRISEP